MATMDTGYCDYTRVLPPEMIYSIFCLLSPQDMRTVMLVCRRWREVGQDCRLWSWVRIVINQDNIETMSEILDCTRLRMLGHLELRRMTDDILESVLRLRGIQTLKIGWCDLTTHQFHYVSLHFLNLIMNTEDMALIDSGLLARAVTKVEDVTLVLLRLNVSQITAICNAITEESRIKRLSVRLDESICCKYN